MAKQAATELGKKRKARKGKTEEDTDRALAILAILEWRYPELAAYMKPVLERAAREGVNVGAYQMANIGAPLDEVIREAEAASIKAAGDRAYEMVGLKVEDDGTIAEATGPHWAISTTAKDDVLASIKQAITEDWTPDQLEAVIQAATIFQPEHADLIADCEISRQQEQGQVAAWAVSGKVLEYAWMVADLGCCPLCAEFSLQGSVPIGHDFGMGIYEPGAHPICRCWLVVTKFAEDESGT